jgi:hypothetical protein
VSYLGGVAASGFADEDEGLVVAEGAEEFVLLLPHGERAALLEELELPRRVGPPVPPVDGRRRVGRRGGAVDGGAAELGGEGGHGGLVVVDHVEEAHFPLPFRPHVAAEAASYGGGSGAAFAVAARREGGKRAEKVG